MIRSGTHADFTGGPHTGHSVVSPERRVSRARLWRTRYPAAPAKYGYFLFLRWIRVFFSSLRCFFFAMRLRRFLITEPIGTTLHGIADDGQPTRTPGRGGWTPTRG